MSNMNNQNKLLEWAKHVLLNNWPSKVLSLVLALILWTFLITQDATLTREKNIGGVTINVTGVDSMKRNGYIVVSGLDEQLKNASITVDVPQGVYKDAQESNYNVRIDLSRINAAGTQAVRVQATNSSAYGKVLRITPAAVDVVVEEYTSGKRIQVVTQPTGELPEGFAMMSSSLNPSVILVSGPKSIVETIVSAEAVVDYAALPAKEGSNSRAVNFRLINHENEVVESPLLTVTSADGSKLDTLNVSYSLASKRAFAISELSVYTGEPAEGYEVQGVYITPGEVVATGLLKDLSVLNELVASQKIDVSGLTRSVSESLRIHRPTEVTQLKPDSVTVTIEIGPEMVSRTFRNLPIEVINVRSGLTAHYSNIYGEVTVTGPYRWVSELNADSISLVCNASNINVGRYPMPVLLRMSGVSGVSYEYQISPEAIMVELTAAE